MEDLGKHKSRAVRVFFNKTSETATIKALAQAKLGRGPLAGKTGNRLVDDRANDQPTVKSQRLRGPGIKPFDPFAK